MVFFRWIVGLPLAAIVTAGLFFMMAGLIQQDTRELPEATPYPDLQIHAQKTDTIEDPYKPPRPDPDLVPPDIDIVTYPPIDGPGPIIDPTPLPQPGPRFDGGGVGFPQPVITFPPPYPENCRSRSAEGTVTVQFDVTPEGNVVNPRIIQTVDRCFNRTVIRTVSKWKYPPAAKGSRTGMRRGVTTVIRFELQD